MRITFEHYDEIITKEIEGDDHPLSRVFEDLIIPVLLGAGFAEKGIMQHLCTDGNHSTTKCKDCEETC